MINDHKVKFRSQESILVRVMKERQDRAIDHLCCFNTRSVVGSFLNLDGSNNKKPKLVFIDADREPYFNRKEISVNVNRELWDEAAKGEPLANFKLFHEIAHSLLHLHPILAFSRSEHSQIAYACDEESAEWQAHVFAAFFLAPPYLATDCKDRKSFSERFNFPSEYIDFWFNLLRRRPLKYTGEFCSRCGSQTSVRIGYHLKCVNCQHTS